MAHHMLSSIWRMPIGYLNVKWMLKKISLSKIEEVLSSWKIYTSFSCRHFIKHIYALVCFFKRRIYALVDSWYIYIYIDLNKYVQHICKKKYNIVYIFLIYSIKSTFITCERQIIVTCRYKPTQKENVDPFRHNAYVTYWCGMLSSCIVK